MREVISRTNSGILPEFESWRRTDRAPRTRALQEYLINFLYLPTKKWRKFIKFSRKTIGEVKGSAPNLEIDDGIWPSSDGKSPSGSERWLPGPSGNIPGCAAASATANVTSLTPPIWSVIPGARDNRTGPIKPSFLAGLPNYSSPNNPNIGFFPTVVTCAPFLVANCP